MTRPAIFQHNIFRGAARPPSFHRGLPMLLVFALWLACLGAWRPAHAEPLLAMQRVPVVAPEPEFFRNYMQRNHGWFQRLGIMDAEGCYPMADTIPAEEYAPRSFAREFYERADLTAFPSMFLPAVSADKATFSALGVRYQAEEPYILFIEDKPWDQNLQISLTMPHIGSLDWDGNGIRDWLFSCRILLHNRNVDLGSFLLVLNPQPTGPLDIRLLRVTYWPSNDSSKYINYFGTAARDYLFTVMRDRLPAIYPGWTPPARAEDLPWRDAPGMEGVGYVEHVDEGKK